MEFHPILGQFNIQNRINRALRQIYGVLVLCKSLIFKIYCHNFQPRSTCDPLPALRSRSCLQGESRGNCRDNLVSLPTLKNHSIALDVLQHMKPVHIFFSYFLVVFDARLNIIPVVPLFTKSQNFI